jgi:hypothetical protein
MKPIPFAGIALALALVGCKTATFEQSNHWHPDSVGPRVAHHFLGYDADRDGAWRDFDWRQKQSINLTLRRHLLNDNPYNPMEEDDPTLNRPRPPHSLVPYPWHYIHLEGLVVGAIMLNPSVGIFIPIPPGSVIGTLDDGGTDEFMEGVGTTVRPIGVMTVTFTDYTIGEKGPVRATWTRVTGLDPVQKKPAPAAKQE